MVQRPDSNCPPHDSQSKSQHPRFPATHSSLSSTSALTSASDFALSQPPTPIPTPNPTSNPRMSELRKSDLETPDRRTPDPRTSSPSASDLDNLPVPYTHLWTGMVCRRNDLPRECEEVSRLGRVYGPLSDGGSGNQNGGGGSAEGSSSIGGGVGTGNCQGSRRISEGSVGRLPNVGRESEAEHDSSSIVQAPRERGSVKDETTSGSKSRTCPQSAGSISSTPTPRSPSSAPSQSPPTSASQQARSQPESQSHTRVGRSFRPPFTKPSHMPFKGLHRSFPSCDDLHQGYDTDVP